MCRVDVAGRLVAEVEHGIVDQRPSDATRCLFATVGFHRPMSCGGAVCHHEGMSDTSFVSVGPKGRVVIPVAIRRALDLREGSELVATVDDGAVVLVPRSAVKARLRSLFAEVPTSMRDELLVDRRAAAAGESSGG